MPRVFVSYRRADSALPVAALYDKLEHVFGQDNVFMDHASLPSGERFDREITKALEQRHVVILYCIHDKDKWLGVQPKKGPRRIDQRGDFLRIEIEGPLRRLQRSDALHGIRLIPVLLGANAKMPNAQELPASIRDFTELQAKRITEENYSADITGLQNDIWRSFDTTSSIGPVEFVLIDGGRFAMGAHEEDPEAWRWEKPRHDVDVETFWIARTPTTQGQFHEFLKRSGSWPPREWTAPDPERQDHPYVCYHPAEATEFCRWLTREARKAGKNLSGGFVGLTSEAQWEFTAAGGREQRRYPWGNEPPTPDRASYDSGLTSVYAHPRGATPDHGIFDMAGNVFELCSDEPHVVWRYDSGRLNPITPSWLKAVPLRGCDHRMTDQYLRTTWRVGNHQASRRIAGVTSLRDLEVSRLVNWVWTAKVGFRCAFKESAPSA